MGCPLCWQPKSYASWVAGTASTSFWARLRPLPATQDLRGPTLLAPADLRSLGAYFVDPDFVPDGGVARQLSGPAVGGYADEVPAGWGRSPPTLGP